MSFCAGCGTGALESLMGKFIDYNVIFNNEKKIREYRLESDRSFQKFAKKIGNEFECYFELVAEGVYKLRKRFYPR